MVDHLQSFFCAPRLGIVSPWRRRMDWIQEYREYIESIHNKYMSYLYTLGYINILYPSISYIIVNIINPIDTSILIHLYPISNQLYNMD